MAFAIIAAGGRGIRLGSPIPKFELELSGKPLLLYSLEAFEAAPSIESMVLVVPRERVGDWAVGRLHRLGITKLSATVEGGATRRESVGRGLRAMEGRSGTVVVHDAARPLVTTELVERACEVPEGADGVITALEVTDTVKEVDGAAVIATLERERLVAVQTPQAFRIDTLREAHAAAERDHFEGTDDASLVERLGGRVVVIDGSRDNIKVTYGEDLARARAILLERSGG